MALFDGFEKRRVDIGGVEIACVISGSGPPVLLLHGFPQTKAMWAHVAPRLTDRYTVVAADLRGYGDSGKPACAPDNANYSFRAFAADQVALMRGLGFPRFHMIGHDRGGRTGYRMALDHADAVRSLAVMDIVPTYVMLMETNRKVAGAYWHWYYLSLPAPFPERFIASDPDYFFENCLVGWGATKIGDFDAAQLAEYRRCWRDKDTIHGMCSDYRAAVTADLADDIASLGNKVTCPTLVLYGSKGVMASLFDIPAEWRKLCVNVTEASLPGGQFFVDQFSSETADILLGFLDRQRSV
jgi:haloacetate dehalogenase